MNPSVTHDPLAQLRDIHLPAPIGWWPPAPGWYVLTALALIVIGLLTWRNYRRRQQQRFHQTVLTELDNYLQRPSPAWDAINVLIKRVAFIHHPRHVIAGLTGEAWLTWLDKQLENTRSLDIANTAAYLQATIPQTGHPQGAPLQNLHLGHAEPNPYCNGPGRILLTGPYQQHAPTNEAINDLLRLTITQLLTTRGDAC